MPVLSVKTNQPVSNPDTVLKSLSSLVADILSKPESYVMVSLEADQHLMFAGTTDAAAYVELKSLGLPENRTAEFSSAICNALKENLGIDAARIYIEFASPERHMFGWNNATF